MNLYFSSLHPARDFQMPQRPLAVPMAVMKSDSFRKSQNQVRFGMTAAVPAGYTLEAVDSDDTALLRETLEAISRYFQGDLEVCEVRKNVAMLKTAAEQNALLLLRHQGQIVGVGGIDIRNISMDQPYAKLILFTDAHHSGIAQKKTLLERLIEKGRTMKEELGGLQIFGNMQDEAEVELLERLGFELDEAGFEQADFDLLLLGQNLQPFRLKL